MKGERRGNVKNEFLEKLAELCERYNATFYYTTDDDGTHIDLNGEEIFVGDLGYSRIDAAKELRGSKSQM